MQTQTIHQKYLKKAGLIAMVTVLGMAPPLSTDMYMPSLPKMAEYFDALPALVNMTMVAFFVFMSIGMLIMGPLSDRSGRKKIHAPCAPAGAAASSPQKQRRRAATPWRWDTTPTMPPKR